MAQSLLQERTQDPTAALGVNWAYSFTKRRPELRTRYNRRITYQRAKQEDPMVIKEWVATVREAIQEHGSMKMISGTLMKPALQWDSVQAPRLSLQWSVVKDLGGSFREIASGSQSLNV
jgi:hypothetical protein